MFENLSVEELYTMGNTFQDQAHKASLAMSAAKDTADREAARSEAHEYGDKAMKYYHAAAVRNHTPSQYALGMWFAEILDMPEDGMAWIMKAAQLGHGESCDYIAEAYRTGKNLKQDMDQAEYWRREAIRNRSSLQTEYVREQVAKNMEDEAKSLGLFGLAMLAVEVLTAFGAPLFATIVGFIDMAFFESWKVKKLRGYRGYGQRSLIEIRLYLSLWIHMLLIVVMFFKNWLFLIPLCIAKFYLSSKLMSKAKCSVLAWDDPSSWDWTKYAEETSR